MKKEMNMPKKGNGVLIAVMFSMAALSIHAEEITGVTYVGEVGVTETVAQIMERAPHAAYRSPYHEPLERARKMLDDSSMVNPDAPAISHWPLSHEPCVLNKQLYSIDHIFDVVTTDDDAVYRKPQALGGVFPVVGNAFPTVGTPPDTMGAVGPTQFGITLNGTVRFFLKSTGSVVGQLNTDLDNFFGQPAGTTTDPRIRYDRHSKRWYIICISKTETINNRIFIAVSSGSTIVNSASFTKFTITVPGSIFLDYCTLGIDAAALYIGGVPFNSSGAYAPSLQVVLVVNKASLLAGGPVVFTALPISGATMKVPQGVDNFDVPITTTYGYFVGVSGSSKGLLTLARILNPGGTPTISTPVAITVPQTALPIGVPTFGRTNNSGTIDGGDDRLQMGVIRNNQLWTTHQVGVTAQGVCSIATSENTRNGARWYQIDLSATTDNTVSARLVQAGTLYGASFVNTTTTGLNYWIPSLMVSGQGHMALGCSTAGAGATYTVVDQVVGGQPNAAAAGRLAADSLGSIQSATSFTNTTTFAPYNKVTNGFIYNASSYRWGDYSYTSLDPSDDMTMWTIQEFASGPSTAGVRVAKLLAPPPATPISATPSILQRNSSNVIAIVGRSVNGSGFFDPGPAFDNRLTVTLSGVDGLSVVDVTCLNPLQLTLTLSVGPSSGNVNFTVTNPDGQSITVNNFLQVVSPQPRQF